MRTLSILGMIFGLFISVFSILRWGVLLYDDFFRMSVGISIGISFAAFSYIIDWMALRDKLDENKYKKIDSLSQEMKGINELINLKK